MPIFLTIQKPDCARLSVTGFAASHKPNIFDGTNFKRWQNKMILWLTAMHVIRDSHHAGEARIVYSRGGGSFRGGR
jgi:hypothetical protein